MLAAPAGLALRRAAEAWVEETRRSRARCDARGLPIVERASTRRSEVRVIAPPPASSVDPGPRPKKPPGHASHAAAPPRLKVPASQGEHSAAPEDEEVPPGQAAHAVIPSPL